MRLCLLVCLAALVAVTAANPRPILGFKTMARWGRGLSAWARGQLEEFATVCNIRNRSKWDTGECWAMLKDKGEVYVDVGMCTVMTGKDMLNDFDDQNDTTGNKLLDHGLKFITKKCELLGNQHCVMFAKNVDEILELRGCIRDALEENRERKQAKLAAEAA